MSAPHREPDYTVAILAPAAWLNDNDRRHPLAKARIVKQWRQAAGWQAKAAHLPRLQRVHVVAWLGFPTLRRRDPNNWEPTAKAAMDGLTDAGVWPDDDAAHVTGPDMRLGDRWPSPGRLVLGIYDLDGQVGT